jgi:hypothetical protein
MLKQHQNQMASGARRQPCGFGYAPAQGGGKTVSESAVGLEDRRT